MMDKITKYVLIFAGIYMAAHILVFALTPKEPIYIEPSYPPIITASTLDTIPEPVEAPKVRFYLTNYERDLVERVVMAEAGNQPLEGQMAVAQCILNTAEATKKAPDAVVLAQNQYAKPSNPEAVTNSVKLAVSKVFDMGEVVTQEPIRYFYAPKYSAGSWHESALAYVMTIDGHKFFKLK